MTGWTVSGEREVLLWINQHHHPLLDWVLVPISAAGEAGACWILVIGVLWIWGSRALKQRATRLAVTLAVASLCVTLPLRHTLPRARPHVTVQGVRRVGVPLKGHSFPSGHAQSAWTAALILGDGRRRLFHGLLLFALLMTYSRVYCGMHYPLDVLAGALIGVAAGLVALAWARRTRAAGPDPTPEGPLPSGPPPG